MAHSFLRLELYDLVWTEPMRTIAARLDISDVWLAKACRKAAIPVPPRGYWAKKQAGYKLSRLPLPPREPGHEEKVTIGYEHWQWPQPPIDESAPEPVAPDFDEPIEGLRARIEKRTAAVHVSPGFELAHASVRKLLEQDDRRREKQRESSFHMSWLDLVFDNPLQQRRLRILNALLLSLTNQGFDGSVHGEKGEEITVNIGQTSIELELSETTSASRAAKDAPRPRGERLKLGVRQGHKTSGKTLAEDERGRKIEGRLRAAVVELIVLGEERYRERAIEHHQWLVQRRKERIEEAKKQKAEAEREERERLAALEKARIDRLLGEAASLRAANDIRSYVETVRATSGALEPPVTEEALSAWAEWALTQADLIDPVLTRRFLEDPEGLRHS